MRTIVHGRITKRSLKLQLKLAALLGADVVYDSNMPNNEVFVIDEDEEE